VDPVDVLIATGQTQAHVVLLAWPPSGSLPGICTHLLDAYPDLLIVGLRTDGQGLYAVRQAGVAEVRGETSLASVLAALRKTIPEATDCWVIRTAGDEATEGAPRPARSGRWCATHWTSCKAGGRNPFLRGADQRPCRRVGDQGAYRAATKDDLR